MGRKTRKRRRDPFPLFSPPQDTAVFCGASDPTYLVVPRYNRPASVKKRRHKRGKRGGDRGGEKRFFSHGEKIDAAGKKGWGAKVPREESPPSK